MSTMLEKTLEQIDGSDRADYHKLVVDLVEHPEVEIAAELVRAILAGSGKSGRDLLADVDRVSRRREACENLKAAEQAVAERCGDLDQREAAAKTRFQELQTQFLREMAVQAHEATTCESEAHQLRMAVIHATGHLRQTFYDTSPRSARDNQQHTDWRAIDLFASDEVPRNPENHWQQPRSERVAGVGCMGGARRG